MTSPYKHHKSPVDQQQQQQQQGALLRALVEAQAPPVAAAAGAAAGDAHRAAFRGVGSEDHGAGHGPFAAQGGTAWILGEIWGHGI